MGIELEEVEIRKPEDTNVILGYSHFIKTVEDLTEIMQTTAPGSRYSITFCEASGPRLIRYNGNDDELIKYGIENMERVASGHSFLIIMRDAFPISVLNSIKACQEVGTIYAATANPLTVIIARSGGGGGILGVIDGGSPLGVEEAEDKEKRRKFLRDIGYKN